MIEVDERRRARELQRARINAAMELLSDILSGRITSRVTARKRLEDIYRSKALQPIRGRAWPPDIWDKELATVYTVGKYALMLNEEEPEVFSKIFSYEESLEDIINAIKTADSDEEARRFILFMLGGSVDDNTIARILRIATTKYLLGFTREDEVVQLIQRLYKVLPEQSNTIRKYARYFIAVRIAQAIALGSIRSRIEKEALKQALAAKIGLERIMPDDEYVEFIASNVFNVPKRIVQRILGGRHGRQAEKRERSRKRGRSAAGS